MTLSHGPLAQVLRILVCFYKLEKAPCLGKSLGKSLNDSDNHDGVVTHLEPDILVCDVKWALGSIATKLVKMMEFQLSCCKS